MENWNDFKCLSGSKFYLLFSSPWSNKQGLICWVYKVMRWWCWEIFLFSKFKTPESGEIKLFSTYGCCMNHSLTGVCYLAYIAHILPDKESGQPDWKQWFYSNWNNLSSFISKCKVKYTVYFYTSKVNTHTHTHTHTHEYKLIHTCIYIHKYEYMYANIYISVCVYIYIYIYILPLYIE